MLTNTTFATTKSLAIGQTVHVNAHHRWLPATVHAVTRTAVTVAPQHDPTRRAVVAPWVIRPADGARLTSPARLRCGDQLLTFDGRAHDIATVWRGRNGWWLITYTTGETTTVAPGAVVRIVDTQPPVTVRRQRGDS
jgi:hypothetical protein